MRGFVVAEFFARASARFFRRLRTMRKEAAKDDDALSERVAILSRVRADVNPIFELLQVCKFLCNW
jgi:hypothetical protein